MRSWLPLLMLLVGGHAHAVRVEAKTVPCPVGDTPVKVFRLVSQNTHGGWDSDGATYSTNGQFRSFEIATCPDNLLTLYGADMEQRFDAEQRAAVKAVLEAVAKGVDEPKKLQVWERYAIAALVYEALGAEPIFLAHLYIKAGWTARDYGVGVYEGLEGPIAVRTVLDQASIELERPNPPVAQRLVLINLARVAHRGGYGDERDHWLAELKGRDDLTDGDTTAIERLEGAVLAEKALQEQAAKHLSTMLAGTSGSTAQRLEAAFLLADVHRRNSKKEEALPLFDRVVAAEDAPDQMRGLAQYLAAELRGEKPWEAAEGLRLEPIPTP